MIQMATVCIATGFDCVLDPWCYANVPIVNSNIMKYHEIL